MPGVSGTLLWWPVGRQATVGAFPLSQYALDGMSAENLGRSLAVG